MKRLYLWLGLFMLIGSAPVTHAENEKPTVEAPETVMSATYAVYADPLGSLRVAGHPAQVRLDVSGKLQFTQSMKLEIEYQGDSGWQYVVSLDDFTIRHTVQEGNIQARIPAGYASYQVSGVTSEQRSDGITTGSGVFASGAPQVVLEATEGYGRGIYSADLLLQVDLPSLIEVAEVTSTDRISPGERVGLMAGEYSANLTFTLVSGI
ncbi:hypothetical protein H1230_30055 [Paenibacillus sp. 19GGS1-52]|uniref:hypothetical protein n=1 Tax=Paenibacillus sp. 19GGS1-52 TaxID=2758563 RepID=UPI001EFA33BE|nr:hypothetical protein [Paenibacillus sp. 19GGS1-52]ULO07132.1 hypothetical protein H1230_30055 [Paenibacillus sp. 19GGS1-52]